MFDEFVAQAGITAGSKADVKQAAAAEGNGFQRAIKVLSDVFVPSSRNRRLGMLMGIMSALQYMGTPVADGGAGFFALDTTNVWWRIASLINACALGNLQILLGFSAATVFIVATVLGASWALCSSAPTSSTPTARLTPSPRAP